MLQANGSGQPRTLSTNGARALFVVPAGECWRVMSGYGVLNSGATAGTRKIYCTFKDAAGLMVCASAAFYGLGPSLTLGLTLGEYGYAGQVNANGNVAISLPRRVTLGPGCVVEFDAGAVAGDSWSEAQLYVETWATQ